jgi:hypothetical protein
MNRIATWANRHDYTKLIVITLAMIPVMLLVVATADDLSLFLVLAGVALCGVAAYWLGNWKWILIPVLAMLVEIVCAVPAVMRDPNAGETPISIVLEAPFWTGLPALIGAGAGYLFKRRSKAAEV